MEHGNGSLTSLILVVTVSFLIPIVLYKLRLRLLPVVVAEILSGLVIGKSGFNWVGNDPWVTLLSLLGLIYLMFLSGLEIDFSSFARKKSNVPSATMNPLATALLIFLLIFLLSGLLSMSLVWLGLTDRAFLMTLIIGTISLGVVVPVLKERQILRSELGQTLLLIAVLADFFTMILLAVYVSMLSRNVSSLLLLLLFFLLVAAIYFLVRRFASRKVFQALSESTVQFGTRAIFALLLAIVFLSESLGVENILGAFLAGMIVSLLKPKHEFVHQLESFGYGFLIPIFFVMVGVNLDLWPLLTNPKILLLIPLLLLLMFISKMAPMLVLRKWFPWREVVSSGILLSSTLSLVIAAATLALKLGMIDEGLHGALILVAILSCLIFPVLYNKLAPKVETRRQTVAMVGMNHISIPVAQDLLREQLYDIRLFTESADSPDTLGGSRDLAVKPYVVARLEPEELERLEALQADVLVLATMNDEANLRLARYARERSDRRVIVRLENPERRQAAEEEGLETFSTLDASRTVLRTLIESPGALQFISEDAPLHEVSVERLEYPSVLLRRLPLPRGLLILRIYRGDSFLIPHGNTEIRRGDRLLVSGPPEQVEDFRRSIDGGGGGFA